MNLDRLYEIVKEATVTMDNVPADSEHPTVDVHFMVIGVYKEKADSHKNELVSILQTYSEPDRLRGGPSYIEIGGVIGSQETALRLMGLGQVLGLWKVITPATVGITGKEADQLAGAGMVMISGFKEPRNE